MKLIFATGNLHKLQEAGGILGPAFTLVTPKSLGLDEEPEETGDTMEENSLIKAQFVLDHLGGPCFADDSGLEVEALGGLPGVHTARYAAGDPRFKDNLDKLLYELGDRPEEQRKAQFRTVVTYIAGPGAEPVQITGIVKGVIGTERKGVGGFGYDPVFIPDMIPGPDGSIVPNTGKLAMAELPDGAKNMISHRGLALRALAKKLEV